MFVLDCFLQRREKEIERLGLYGTGIVIVLTLRIKHSNSTLGELESSTSVACMIVVDTFLELTSSVWASFKLF